ncbi:MAG: endopeptidase La [Lachnospiraceae bacterium]|nr:endopeptidase La [Lachnospiraceae bacterium]
MIYIPCYNLVMLAGVTYYFEKDYFKDLAKTEAKKDEEVLFLILKEEKKQEEIENLDFYPVGVLGKITGISEEGTVAVTTSARVELEKENADDGTIQVKYTLKADIEDLDEQEEQKRYSAIKQEMFQAVGRFQWAIVARNYIANWKKIDEMVSALSGYLDISNEEKYAMLEADSRSVRFERMEQAIRTYLEMFMVSTEAQEKQQEENEQIYREAAIKKQIEILQNKLDEMHPENVTDIRKFEMKIEKAGMNETAEKEAKKVLGRMKQEGENGHEYGMLYDYLDFVTSLSWKKEPYTPVDLTKAAEILDADHFGLKKVKKRIIQQLAVMELNQKQSGSILLFVGPPGTGKTSIGQSIAKACGRKYVRISLGGIRDEAEIRGHRRTYIGAMPGRIMEGIKRSGASNPVVVLDEVDKLVKDYNGDPSSALLEVLDPEQNTTFTDHYMNVPYDLSDVLFICTANSTDTIPEPLLNRMEVINFQGYTETEKVQIAKKHLIPKSMKQMGIKSGNLKITDSACHTLIAEYTMEAGVRGLKKQIDTLCRTAAVKLVKGEQKSITISPKRLKKFLDTRPVLHDRILEKKQPGVVTGLAWTQAGGDILFIETMLVPGEEKTVLTGQLGDVMKESAVIAQTIVKNILPDKADAFEKKELHIHVPAGAVPKDGPSAGITLTTALASLITGKAVDPEVAMTGEVSLRGFVMPIGGLPEKLLAAVRAGIKTVFIPRENVDDLEDVAEEVKEQLTIIPVHEVKEVLQKTGIF